MAGVGRSSFRPAKAWECLVYRCQRLSVCEPRRRLLDRRGDYVLILGAVDSRVPLQTTEAWLKCNSNLVIPVSP
jgi:hypothetical protein